MWLLLATLLVAAPGAASLGSPAGALTQAEEITFPVSAALEPRVNFWEFIFRDLPSNHYLLHDIKYPELTYSTVIFEVIEGEKPGETVRRLRLFLREAEEDMQETLRALSDGNTEYLNENVDSITLEHLNKLKKDYPDKMKKAWTRVHIQRGAADAFTIAMKRCKPLKKEIQNTLRSYKLPEELYWLVFVESMCTPSIHSFAGAAGLWQLMPDTAREMGLIVTREKDERLSPIKATRAAAKLFKRIEKMLKKWPLILTGYNHGPAGVRKLTTEYKSEDLDYLIENAQRSTFGFASKNFYAEFIAVKRVGTRLEEAKDKETIYERKESK